MLVRLLNVVRNISSRRLIKIDKNAVKDTRISSRNNRYWKSEAAVLSICRINDSSNTPKQTI